MEDDNISASLLLAYSKKFNVDYWTITRNYFDAIHKKRRDFIIDSQKRNRDRYNKVLLRAEEYMNQPKMRKDKLKTLLCHSLTTSNMTDEEFETWFKNVYSKEKKKEVIVQQQNPLTIHVAKKVTFTDALDELISKATKELTYEQFKKEIINFPDTTVTTEDAYAYYLSGIEKRKDVARIIYPKQPIPVPFKTKSKQQYLISEDKHPYLKPVKHLTNVFPNNKKFNLHAVSPHGLFIIDLMFVDNTCYLVAIELNTRKLYIEPTNIINESSDYETVTKDKKNTILYLIALQKIISSGANIKALRGDGEGAFNSHKSQTFYQEHGISFIPVSRIRLTNGKTEPNHNSLAIVDRVIRTIRDMSFNSKLKLTSTTITQFVQIYNDTPHSTLSKVMGFEVTPNIASSDIELETEIVRRIQQQNFSTVHSPMFSLMKGVKCTVLENYDQFAKKRSKIKPDLYEVIDFKGNKYLLQNVRTHKKIIESRKNLNPQSVIP